MTKKGKAERVEQAREWLLKAVPPETTVYCIHKRSSQNGDYHHFRLVVIFTDYNKKLSIQNISASVATLLDRKLNDTTGGVCIRGGGMDMAFALVCELGYALHGDERSLHHQWL